MVTLILAWAPHVSKDTRERVASRACSARAPRRADCRGHGCRRASPRRAADRNRPGRVAAVRFVRAPPPDSEPDRSRLPQTAGRAS